MRDFEIQPYTKDEQRVAEWIVQRSGVGGGDDPIGFVLASYEMISSGLDKSAEILTTKLSPIHKDAKGWWFYDDFWEGRDGPYETFSEVVREFKLYSENFLARRKENHICSTCGVQMKNILDTTRHKQWLCMECGWVVVNQKGDTRWL